MKKWTFFLFLTLLLSSCSHFNRHVCDLPKPPLEVEQASEINNCLCIQLWLPVCGENGKTYSNACFAKCANVSFKQGSCLKQSQD